jgi:MurNAc alpha-1-phosphate uridylyltransferase
MRAMILAAGRGNRLRPLTDSCPKPLIKVGDKPLIVYHLEHLQEIGITEVVINLRHLGEQIHEYVGTGKKWNLNIAYSWEEKELEVGGGINHALPLLGSDPFIIINGDIYTDYPFEKLLTPKLGLAHLVLVQNPAHNSEGDYALNPDNTLTRSVTSARFTYSGISVLHPALFADCLSDQSFRLTAVLDRASLHQKLYGECYNGYWTDVGTVERLACLEKHLKQHVYIR